MPANPYETDRSLAEYLLFHYGRLEDVLSFDFGPHDALNFAVRCVSECVDESALPENSRALDLGCAVGRSSFELARLCREVIGIDYSRSFIDAANRLKEDGSLPFNRIDEGELTTVCSAEVPPDIDRSRVSFETGDAHDLRDHLGQFDVLLMANLIDRLHNPRALFQRLPGLLNPGGQLVITSPCTWLEAFTPRANWLGGYVENGKPVRTRDTLDALLKRDFEFVAARDLPFLIREHSRKFQWSVAEATVWRRR